MDFCGPQRKVSRLVLAALSVLIYDTGSATDSPPTPTSVELEILRKGASATLNRLYSHDSKWDAVRSGIASEPNLIQLRDSCLSHLDQAPGAHIEQVI